MVAGVGGLSQGRGVVAGVGGLSQGRVWWLGWEGFLKVGCGGWGRRAFSR